MKAHPAGGDRYYQEIADGVAMERVEVTALDDTITTPAGEFRDCVVAKETSPFEPGVSTKAYAPGVGMIRDDAFVLIRVTKP